MFEKLKEIGIRTGDGATRIILTAFYFTLLAPFALLSRMGGESPSPSSETTFWVGRKPLETELPDARRGF